MTFKSATRTTLLTLALTTSLGIAGCASAPKPSYALGDAAAAIVETPFFKDGQTTFGACVGALLTGVCQYVSDDSLLVLEYPGDAVQVVGNITWDSVAQMPLDVRLLVLGSGGAWVWNSTLPMEGSDSGLISFAWNASGLGPVAIAARASTGVGLPALGVGAGVPFDFHLEGRVVSLAAPMVDTA